MRGHLARYVLIPLSGIIIAVLFGMISCKRAAVPQAKDEKPEVYVQRGHRLGVPCVSWSPDGLYILSGDWDGQTILWDARSGRELRKLDLSSGGSVSGLAFLPDGKRFVMACSDSGAKIWDLNTFSEIKRLHVGARVRAVALSARGDKLLCTTQSPTAFLWDIKSGRELRRFATTPDGSWCAALSPDGCYALTEGPQENTLTLWETASGRTLREFPVQTGRPLCAVFSADGKRIACGSGDRLTLFAARFWGYGGSRTNQDSASIDVRNVSDGALVCHIEPKNYAVSTVQFEPDGRHLITTAVDSTVSWWNLESCSLATQLVSGGSLVLAALVSSDRRQMVTVGDENMRIWDIARKEIVRTFTVPAFFDGRAGFSERGDKICIAPQRWGSRNREFAERMFVWDARTGRRVAELDPQPGKRLYAFSDDCRYGIALVNANEPETGERQRYFLEFWSLEQGLLGRTTQTVDRWTGSWDFTKDGRYALTNTGDSVYTLWETASGWDVRRIYWADPPSMGDKWITGLDGVSLSDDGRYAVVGRQPAAVLMDFATGESEIIRSSTDSTTSIADCRMSADGKLALFTWRDHTVDVWDVSRRQLLHSYEVEGFGGGDGMLGSGMAISRDKSILIATMMPRSHFICPNDSGTLDTLPAWTMGSTGIWNSQTGKLLRELGRSAGRPILSDDERYLISPSTENGTLIWNKETGKEIVQFVSFENGEWVAVTPEGYFTASINGDAFLNVRTGTKITGIEPYRSTFYQPAVVEAALRLGDSELAISEVLGCKDQCTTIADLPDLEPPHLTVQYPADGDTLSTPDTVLAFRIEDRRFPIRVVRVFVNARPVTGRATRSSADESITRSIQLDIPKDKKLLDLKVPLRLDEGENLITITALGGSEAVSSLSIYVTAAGVLPEHMEIDTVWILAVGVNKYQDKKLRSLNYCVNDAQGIIRAFQKQEGKTCRKVMSLCISDAGPKRPTFETIVDNIGFLRQAAEHDLAILFLAGHGVNDAHGDFYFLPSDAEVTTPHEFKKSRAISGAQLQTAVDVPARRFVFMDACHSGDVGVDLVKLAREFKDNRVLILTSSEGSTPSEEADSLKHGVFTYTMIRGLEGDADIIGSDGKVSAMELVTYVSDRVSTMTKRRQKPVFWAPGGISNFVVAIGQKRSDGIVASLP